jgi:hypothetical protein
LIDRGRPGAAGRFVLFDSAVGGAAPALGRGQLGIDVARLRRQFDDDPFEAMLREEAAPHAWNVAGRDVVEEAAAVARRTVREQMLAALRGRIEQAGGVWLTVAPYPFPCRGALCVRLDHDRFEPADFDSMLRVIEGCEEATTHFVAGEAFRGRPEALGRLRGLDVGTHGYAPQWGPAAGNVSAGEKRADLGRAVEQLRAAGIEPRGYAAPDGRFDPEMLAAADSAGLEFASDYGFACDDLPLEPRGSRLLQVPVHPLTLRAILATVPGDKRLPGPAVQQAVQAALDYFRQTARAKYRSGEPVFFRGHPAGGMGQFPQVLRAIFDTADAFAAVWRTSLARFADWWRARRQVRLRVFRDEGRYVVVADGRPREYCLGIEYWRGRHVARLPLGDGALDFAPTAPAYENCGVQGPLRPVRLDPSEALRLRARRGGAGGEPSGSEARDENNWSDWALRALRRWRRAS